MKKQGYWVLVGILVIVALALRLYKIRGPIADWQSFRQADTAAVARNFVKFGFDPFRPRDDDLSNIQSGKDNPLGYRMVEFPIYQTVAYAGFRLYPGWPIEMWLRLTNIAASIGTMLVLILLASRFTNRLVGLFTGFIYAVLPYSIYYGRAILPDTFGVFWAALSLYLLSRAEFKFGWLLVILAGCSAAIALLTKPMTAFILTPAFYLVWTWRKSWQTALMRALVFGVIAVVPLLGWRSWILKFPSGIPASEWLYNSNHIRFKGAWFYWLFADRLGNLILGYWGLVLFTLGLLVKPDKSEGGFLKWFVVGVLTYFIVFATGNVQHDYYQIMILPTVALFVGKGLGYLLTNKVLSKPLSILVAIVSLSFMLGFSWYTIRTYYWINRPEIIEAGQTADRLLPATAKVIAPYNGDTAFLYQTNRQGWPIGFDIDKKIQMGAAAYVTVSPTDSDLETKMLASRYRVLVRNDKYAIIDLRFPKAQQ